MKTFKIVIFYFYLQNLKHSLQNDYIYLSGAMKLKEALKSLHNEYLEKNPFAAVTKSNIEDACQSYHLVDFEEEADDIEIYNFYFFTLLIRNTKYEQLFIPFSNTIKISNVMLTQI